MYFKHCESILTNEDCDNLIKFGNDSGFEKATVNYYGDNQNMPNIRNNSRLEWDNQQLSLELESKIKVALGNNFPYLFDSFIYTKTGSHFRMYKYIPYQYFKPHKDGHYIEGEEESHITVLFYLNDTDGGETVLMPNGFKNTEDYIIIKPKKGDILLFEHSLWHEGKPVHTGEKYVLRTDLFYKFE